MGLSNWRIFPFDIMDSGVHGWNGWRMAGWVGESGSVFGLGLCAYFRAGSGLGWVDELSYWSSGCLVVGWLIAYHANMGWMDWEGKEGGMKLIEAMWLRAICSDVMWMHMDVVWNLEVVR